MFCFSEFLLLTQVHRLYNAALIFAFLRSLDGHVVHKS